MTGDPYRELANRDQVLAKLLDEYGSPDPFAWLDGGRTGSSNFAAMVLHIVGQQISMTVAFIVFDRIATATRGVPTPPAILALGADQLRATGLSRMKAAYIIDLARRQADGDTDLDQLDALDDDAALKALTALRGVGTWSAEMFLIFQLHRPDILPAGDAGIRRAIREAWQLPDMPTINETQTRALTWAPHRTYAAALLWRSLDLVQAITKAEARK